MSDSEYSVIKSDVIKGLIVLNFIESMYLLYADFITNHILYDTLCRFTVIGRGGRHSFFSKNQVQKVSMTRKCHNYKLQTNL